ncbi:hypothetical protein [uncultured Microbacterium sp.]|nr:hypothetical protein [uncultured Microbacterium sp.]
MNEKDIHPAGQDEPSPSARLGHETDKNIARRYLDDHTRFPHRVTKGGQF